MKEVELNLRYNIYSEKGDNTLIELRTLTNWELIWTMHREHLYSEWIHLTLSRPMLCLFVWERVRQRATTRHTSFHLAETELSKYHFKLSNKRWFFWECVADERAICLCKGKFHSTLKYLVLLHWNYSKTAYNNRRRSCMSQANMYIKNTYIRNIRFA